MFASQLLYIVYNQLKVCFLRCSADERNIYMVGFFLVAFGLYVVMPFPGRSMPIQVECESVAHRACGQDSAECSAFASVCCRVYIGTYVLLAPL